MKYRIEVDNEIPLKFVIEACTFEEAEEVGLAWAARIGPNKAEVFRASEWDLFNLPELISPYL